MTKQDILKILATGSKEQIITSLNEWWKSRDYPIYKKSENNIDIFGEAQKIFSC